MSSKSKALAVAAALTLAGGLSTVGTVAALITFLAPYRE